MTEPDVRNPGGMFTKCAEWRPIETAPKDGTQILIWDGESMSVAEFTIWPDGSAGWEVGHDARGKRLFVSNLVTHWMPLPDPPSATLVRSREAR